MKSMTGFGSGEAKSENGLLVVVDIVSYNKKQLDVRAQMPKELLAFDHIVKKTVSSKIARGAVTVRVDVAFDSSSSVSNILINKNRVKEYINEAKSLCETFDLPVNIDINKILEMPGVIEEISSEDLLDEKTLLMALNIALDEFLQMRTQEGEALQVDILSRVKKLEFLVKEIAPMADIIPKRQFSRLMENLKKADLTIDSNDDRVVKEMVIFVDRYDVSEEVTRLYSHFEQCYKLIQKNEPIGRAFEFLIQEIQREINTLGTKAAQCAISPLVIEFKTELEKIREQVQNVE